MAALRFDLTKAENVLRFSLEKVGVVTPPEAEVAFLIDVSGSFERDHVNGETNLLLTRLVPWSMVFDPDKKIDVFTFSGGSGSAHYVGDANVKNYANYVNDRVIRKVPGWGGGTQFTPIFRKVIQHMGWGKHFTTTVGLSLPQKERSFFDRLFGRNKPKEKPVDAHIVTRTREGKTALVIMVTDGENYDKEQTRGVLLEASEYRYNVFFLFLGIERNDREFEFLRDINETLENVGFVRIPDIRKFVRLDDEQINAQLLVPKLITWLKTE